MYTEDESILLIVEAAQYLALVANQIKRFKYKDDEITTHAYETANNTRKRAQRLLDGLIVDDCNS